MAKVIIFGIRNCAELAHYYLSNDSNHEVVAFCVHKEYLPEEKFFKSLPIVDLDSVDQLYSVDKFKFFAPMSPIKMNTLRENIYNCLKEKGYSFISYVSSKAIISNNEIGENCLIQEGNTLHPFSKIGNNVMIWSDNTIAHHSLIKDHVTISSQVIVGGNCVIGENSFLGVNSSIRNGLSLAKGTLVSMATAIDKNTDEWCVYLGNPAKRIGNKISKSILTIRGL